MASDESIPPRDPKTQGKHERGKRFPVVGIGASAGGLEALEVLLRRLSPDVGAAVVIVLHLDPSHPSMASQILARGAHVPVHEASDGTILAPNEVHVIPPNASLRLEGSTLRVITLSTPRHTSIDDFLRSLADAHGEAAVGVVLSGAGSDGAAGLQAIKAHGGVTIAQDPEEARTDSMPRSAIALSTVDWVLPAGEIPAKIAEYGEHLASRDERPTAPAAPEEQAEQLERVCGIVLRRTGHDFSKYKQATVLRRVLRRAEAVDAPSLAAYVDSLRESPDEVDRLFSDLLIGVTRFFRDPEVFSALAAQVVPKLLDGRAADGQVRVWVAGCATGEEAYSVAFLLREVLSRAPGAGGPVVKIFATDIDEAALEVARLGRYPQAISEQVSPERLGRFFFRYPGGYQVTKEIRDMCVFSAHNIVSDPPFSRLDLISCRNLLIYLDSEIQKKLVPLFNYALAPGGYLVLGPSENLVAFPELFRSVDKESRVFQRQEGAIGPPVVFPLVGPRRFDSSKHMARPSRPARGEQDASRTFERILLDELAPPAVLVNQEGRILYVSGRTGRFLQLPPGATRTHVVDMAYPALRASLHTTLHRAVKSGAPAIHEDLTVEIDGTLRKIELLVRPLPGAGGEPGLFMVVFRELSPGARAPAEPPIEPEGGATADRAEGNLAAQLERELRVTQEHLQTTIEELEASNEELQSANEEMLSTNEELQSSNEELQTSKEELQSINEELHTVNVELVRNVEKLDRANGDLTNLFASTQIAILFLDGDLRIKRFSPAATSLLRLIDGDLGRPLTDLATTLADDDLASEVRQVLATLASSDREVRRAEDDRWYIRRVHPYRSLDNVIDGVVVTFLDVTDLKRAQERVAMLAAMVESSQDAIIGQTLDGTITTWNAGAERVFGHAVQEAVGEPFVMLFPSQRRAALDAALERARRGEHVQVADVTGVRRDGSPVDVFLTFSAVRDASGEQGGLSMIAHDVTQMRRSEERLRLAIEATLLGTTELDATSGAMRWSPRAKALWGFAPDQEVTYDAFLSRVHPDDRRSVDEVMRGALDANGPGEYRTTYRVLPSAGPDPPDPRWIEAWGRAFFSDAGGFRRPVRLIGTLLDITERKQTESALLETDRRKDRFFATLGHELRNPLAPIRNAVQVMRQVGTSEPALVRAREIIERQVRHMTHLLDDLLDVGRLSSGKVSLRKERVDLLDLVRTAVEEQRPEAAGLSLTASLPDRPLWVHGDPTRLSQCVTNLLVNAVKFTDAGGRVEVSLTALPSPGGPTAALCVRDTGVGLEPEMRARLFEPFSQADRSLDRSRGGLGLGLSLVKSFVEMHGGSVEVQSDGPGKGSAFTLRLPLVDEAPAEAPAPPSPPSPRRVLIIEDNLDAAESMAMMLELSGHTVAVAHSGREGVELARSFQPTTVLCDIGLPGDMDGYAVARALRAASDLQGARLVALTGYGQEDDKLRAREAGFAVHLTKPIDPATLDRVLAGGA